MRQEERDSIKSYYDRTGEWKVNERYSQRHMTVYTKEGNKYHWLALEDGLSGIEVHQTDEHGTIIARDFYKSATKEIHCTGMERIRADGFGMMLFTEKELSLFYQLKEKEVDKERILAELRTLVFHADFITKERILMAAAKLEVLSEASVRELMTTIQNYQLLGRRIFRKEKKEMVRISL